NMFGEWAGDFCKCDSASIGIKSYFLRSVGPYQNIAQAAADIHNKLRIRNFICERDNYFLVIRATIRPPAMPMVEPKYQKEQVIAGPLHEAQGHIQQSYLPSAGVFCFAMGNESHGL